MAAVTLAGAACMVLLSGAVPGPDPALTGLSFPGAPQQMRRLTESQYRASIADIFGTDIQVAGRFAPEMRVDGLLAQGTSEVSLTAAGIEYYEAIARNVAAQVVADPHYDRLVGCKPGPADPGGSACAASFFKRVGMQLFRRPLRPDEVAGTLVLLKAGMTQVGDYRAALAGALTSLLTSADFLFRIDHVVADRTRPGAVRLDGWSRATRLSYFLWNTTPDAELLSAASRGELDSEAGLAAQVDRMVRSPRFKDGVRAFFADFLHLDELSEVTKDSQIYPGFTSGVTAAAREQTLRTVVDLFVDRNADYRELFTTRRVAMNRALSPLYDVPAPAGWSTHEFNERDPRAGLLTQITFLAQHSHPGRSSPTLRGKAVREILMCEKIPSPPANVNFAVVQDVNNPTLKTARARVAAHLDDEECASCHRLTDPLGLALEKFDAAGQFRNEENGEPIDASAEFNKVKFDGALQMGTVLAKDPRISTCLVQSLYRYGSGRALLDEERKLTEALTGRLMQQALRIPDLMRTMAIHPAFHAVRVANPNARVAARASRARGGS